MDGYVIALSLCPFAAAARPHTRLVEEAGRAVLATVRAELAALDAQPRSSPATTLVALSHDEFSSWDAFMQAAQAAQALAAEHTRARPARLVPLR